MFALCLVLQSSRSQPAIGLKHMPKPRVSTQEPTVPGLPAHFSHCLLEAVLSPAIFSRCCCLGPFQFLSPHFGLFSSLQFLLSVFSSVPLCCLAETVQSVCVCLCVCLCVSYFRFRRNADDLQGRLVVNNQLITHLITCFRRV